MYPQDSEYNAYEKLLAYREREKIAAEWEAAQKALKKQKRKKRKKKKRKAA